MEFTLKELEFVLFRTFGPEVSDNQISGLKSTEVVTLFQVHLEFLFKK